MFRLNVTTYPLISLLIIRYYYCSKYKSLLKRWFTYFFLIGQNNNEPTNSVQGLITRQMRLGMLLSLTYLALMTWDRYKFTMKENSAGINLMSSIWFPRHRLSTLISARITHLLMMCRKKNSLSGSSSPEWVCRYILDITFMTEH